MIGWANFTRISFWVEVSRRRTGNALIGDWVLVCSIGTLVHAFLLSIQTVMIEIVVALTIFTR